MLALQGVVIFFHPNFIVKDVRPLAAVQGEGFKEILNVFEPDYTVLSHTTLWTMINRQCDALRESVKEEMQGRSVSLTTNLWTSPTMEPYITVTAHYITNTADCCVISPGKSYKSDVWQVACGPVFHLSSDVQRDHHCPLCPRLRHGWNPLLQEDCARTAGHWLQTGV